MTDEHREIGAGLQSFGAAEESRLADEHFRVWGDLCQARNGKPTLSERLMHRAFVKFMRYRLRTVEREYRAGRESR